MNKGNLIKHQKTAKYCLEIQNKSDKEEQNVGDFSCKFCNKQFTSNSYLNKHVDKYCIERYKILFEKKDKEYEEKLELKDKELCEAYNRIQELENQIKTVRLEVENEMIKERNDRLESTVEEIAKQPKNQINNKILITTALNLSTEKISSVINGTFSHEHLSMGQKGVARFAYDNMLKDDEGKLKYICTDPSRQIFQYKNEEGKIQKDVRAAKLTKALFDADIKGLSHKIAWDNMKDKGADALLHYSTCYQDIQEMENNNGEFSRELSTLAI